MGRYFTMTPDGQILATYTSLAVARENRAIWNWTRGELPRCELFEQDPAGGFRLVEDTQ